MSSPRPHDQSPEEKKDSGMLLSLLKERLVKETDALQIIGQDTTRSKGALVEDLRRVESAFDDAEMTLAKIPSPHTESELYSECSTLREALYDKYIEKCLELLENKRLDIAIYFSLLTRNRIPIKTLSTWFEENTKVSISALKKYMVYREKLFAHLQEYKDIETVEWLTRDDRQKLQNQKDVFKKLYDRIEPIVADIKVDMSYVNILIEGTKKISENKETTIEAFDQQFKALEDAAHRLRQHAILLIEPHLNKEEKYAKETTNTLLEAIRAEQDKIIAIFREKSEYYVNHIIDTLSTDLHELRSQLSKIRNDEDIDALSLNAGLAIQKFEKYIHDTQIIGKYLSDPNLRDPFLRAQEEVNNIIEATENVLKENIEKEGNIKHFSAIQESCSIQLQTLENYLVDDFEKETSENLSRNGVEFRALGRTINRFYESINSFDARTEEEKSAKEKFKKLKMKYEHIRRILLDKRMNAINAIEVMLKTSPSKNILENKTIPLLEKYIIAIDGSEEDQRQLVSANILLTKVKNISASLTSISENIQHHRMFSEAPSIEKILQTIKTDLLHYGIADEQSDLKLTFVENNKIKEDLREKLLKMRDKLDQIPSAELPENGVALKQLVHWSIEQLKKIESSFHHPSKFASKK